MARLTEAQLRETVAAFNATEGNQVKTAHTLGITRRTLQERLERAAQNPVVAPLLKDWPKHRGGGKAQERTLEEDVQLTRAQGAQRHSEARLKDAMREIARLQDEIADLRWASNAGFKPAEWTLPTRKRGKSEHMPYLLTSDFQAGEVMGPYSRPRVSQSYVFECAEGKWLALHMSSPEKFWEGLATTIEKPDLFADPRYLQTVVNTLLYVGIGVNVKMILAFLLSGFFMRKRWWIKALLLVFILPWATPATMDLVMRVSI